MNYCDFNLKTGKPYISQEKLNRIIKDASIIGNKADQIDEKEANIVLFKSLQVKGINLLKTIEFEKYLDCIFVISKLKEPVLFQANPKAALIKVIYEKMFPLH